MQTVDFATSQIRLSVREKQINSFIILANLESDPTPIGPIPLPGLMTHLRNLVRLAKPHPPAPSGRPVYPAPTGPNRDQPCQQQPRKTKSPAGTLIQRGPSDEIWVQNLGSVQRLRSTATSVNWHGDHTLRPAQVCKGTSELPSPFLAAAKNPAA